VLAVRRERRRRQKQRERLCVFTESDGSDILILFLADSSESWVIDLGASFHTTSRHDIFQNYVKDEIGNMYMRDDEPCCIVGKGDLIVSLSNGSTLKLRNVKHVPKLKKI